MEITSVKETRIRRALRQANQARLTGKEAMTLLKQELGLEDEQARNVACKVLTAKILVEADGPDEASDTVKRSKVEFNEATYYTLGNVTDQYILNVRTIDPCNASSSDTKEDAVKLAIDLRKRIMALFGRFLKEDGSGVDYQGASCSQELEDYVLIAERLTNVHAGSLEKDIADVNERKALYLNLYNAMIIHGHISIGNPTTPAERSAFFTKTAYNVGGEIWTLDIIEHVFLRCNKPKPFATAPLLEPTDRRVIHALPLPIDYRIHLALNCGARSCPPVRFYSAEKLDAQLDMATTGFFQDDGNLLINVETNTLKLSKLLEWYGSDFAVDQQSMLRVIAKYLEADKKLAMEKVITSNKAKPESTFTIEFNAYDWSENAT